MTSSNRSWKYSQIGQRPAGPTYDIGQLTAGVYGKLAENQSGGQAYQSLANNYDALTADALATRERNMARVDQYGNSMRSDLNIQNQQALAAANQSAVRRGLGNTTIVDSLRRGTNFDNTRQQLALEDQLLQNRISTDSNLSGVYQNALGDRAKALNSQWNQNIGTNNALYSQGYQMDNANRQAELDRQHQLEMQGYSSSFTPYSIGGGGGGPVKWGQTMW